MSSLVSCAHREPSHMFPHRSFVAHMLPQRTSTPCYVECRWRGRRHRQRCGRDCGGTCGWVAQDWITRTSLDTTAGRSARAGGREAGTGGEERSEAPGKRATRGRRQIEAEIERSEIAADSPAAKRVAQDHRTVHRSGLDVRHPGRQARHSHAARCGNAVSARSQCATLTPRAMSVRI